ncbi:MAG: BACON domain-containing carbohydrate-binding protein [Alistipes sp.]
MKQIINRWLWPLVCISLVLLSACSDDDTESVAQVVPPTMTTEGIPESGMHFLYSAPTPPQHFVLCGESAWEITKSAGWFVCSPKSGKAGEKIEISILADYNQGEARTGELTIRANSGNNLKPCFTEQTVQLAQDAYLAAGIQLTGVEKNTIAFAASDSQPVTFQITATYDWTLVLDDQSWARVSPQSGVAGALATITVTPTPNTTATKHTAKITINTGDVNLGENKAEEVITLYQAAFLPRDTHAEGFSFYKDDFNWIASKWVAPYTKYGWPSVNIDGKNGNDLSLSTAGMKEAVEAKGYDYSSATYARYEGFVKLGKTAIMGSVTTPALANIDAGKGATLLVQFDAALYASAGGTVDNGSDQMYVSVNGVATVGDLVATEIGTSVKNVWSWTRYSVIVYNATAETRITFGSERALKCRLYLDNISVVRAKDSGAEAPAPQAVETPLDKEVLLLSDFSDTELFNKSKQVVGEGGVLQYSVRVNKAWTAQSDCDWLTLTAVKCGATGDGVNNGAALAEGVATVSATGLPYNNTQITVAKGAAEVRTGHVLIKVEDQIVETITVTQEAGNSMRLTISGLTDNAVALSCDKEAAAATVKFKVKGTHAWSVAVPSTDSWYAVTPAGGAAGVLVEVSVKALQTNTGMQRAGAFTLTINSGEPGATPVVETIAVAQQQAAIGSVRWDLASPIQWAFSVEDMPKYKAYFDGDAAATNNALMAATGPGYISYTHTAPSDPDGRCVRIVGATGEPYITGGWPGDYWTFLVPVQNLTAGSKVHFKALSRTSATGQYYWVMEYKDGAEWKPTNALLSAKIKDDQGADLTIEYTHAVAKSNVTVEGTATYANAIFNGNIEIRFRCVANWQTSGKGPLAKPNSGTMRWAGPVGPMIEILP